MSERRSRIRPTQTDRARHLRRDATVPERLLWGRLRGMQVAGARFRRQSPIGPYIVDFYCADARLAIEIDGRSHDDRQQQDVQRTAFLVDHGLRVIRYTNDELIEDLDAVIEDITRYLAPQSKKIDK